MSKIKNTWHKFLQLFFGCRIWGLPGLNRIRKYIYINTFHIGKVDVIGNKVQIVTPHNLIGHINIGNHTDLCDEVYVDFTGDVIIESNVTLSRRVTIYSHKHDVLKLATGNRNDVIPQKVKICQGAWLGDNVIVLPNVVIGEYSVVGAGSVVTKDVPAHCVVAGNPAKVIKENI